MPQSVSWQGNPPSDNELATRHSVMGSDRGSHAAFGANTKSRTDPNN